MVKETKVQLQHCPKEVDTIFIDTLFGKSSSEEAVASIRSAVMGMALSLATSLNDDSLAKHATLYFRGSKIVLESFSRLRAGGVGVDNDENMVLRERCYGLIEEIARRSPLIAIADPQIIAVLFKLLDREDERLSPRLYAALGSLRDVYKERTSLLAQDKTSTENGEGGMKEENHEGDKAMEMALEVESSPPDIYSFNLEASKSISNALSADEGAALRDVLQSASLSPESKKRLAALQWTRAVFDWQPITLKTLELLADDISETVNNLARREYSALNAFLAHTDSVSENNLDQDSGNVRQEVLFKVLQMVHSPSDAFLDPKRPHARWELLKCAASGLASIAPGGPGVGLNSSQGDCFMQKRLWTYSNSCDDLVSSSSLPVIQNLLPGMFVTLTSMPLPADSGLAASTVEAVARLITVMQAYAPSMNTLHFILDIEDRICSWLSLVDANVGLKLARILGTTCLDQDVSASQFSSLLQKLLQAESDSTQGGNSKKAKRDQDRAKDMRARCNVLQCLGALIEVAAHRLQSRPLAAIADVIKDHIVSFFSRVHAALNVVVKSDAYDGMDIDLAATAMQAWTRVVEHGVFTNQYTATALVLNQSKDGSVFEKLMRLVALFKDAEKPPCTFQPCSLCVSISRSRARQGQIRQFHHCQYRSDYTCSRERKQGKRHKEGGTKYSSTSCH